MPSTSQSRSRIPKLRKGSESEAAPKLTRAYSKSPQRPETSPKTKLLVQQPIDHEPGMTQDDQRPRTTQTTSKDSIENLSELLYSAEYLQSLIHNAECLPQFIAFLERYKPCISHLVMHYLKTQKVIKAVDYANAVAATLPPADFIARDEPAKLGSSFRKSSDDAFQMLLKVALPAWVTYCLVRTSNTCLAAEMTGKTTPLTQNLVGGLSEVFCLTDPNQVDNPAVYASQEFYRLTGFERNSVIGHNCRFLQGPKTDRGSVRRLQDAVQNGEEICETVLNYRRSGRPFISILMLAPLVDNEGKVKFSIAAHIDVSKLVEGGRGVDGFGQFLTRRATSRDGNVNAGSVNQLALSKLRDFGASMDAEEIVTLQNQFRTISKNSEFEDTGLSHKRRRISEDEDCDCETNGSKDSGKLQDSALSPVLSPAHEMTLGRLPGIYKKYIVIRPHPSLGVVFSSPSARRHYAFGQDSFLTQLAAPSSTLEGLHESLQSGTPITAKVAIMSGASTATNGTTTGRWGSKDGPSSLGEACWISATPLLDGSDNIGFWMLVMMDKIAATTHNHHTVDEAVQTDPEPKRLVDAESHNKSTPTDQSDQNKYSQVEGESEIETPEQEKANISSTETQEPQAASLNDSPVKLRPRPVDVKSLVKIFEESEGSQDNIKAVLNEGLLNEGGQDNIKATLNGLAALFSTLDLHDGTTKSAEAIPDVRKSISETSPALLIQDVQHDDMNSEKDGADGPGAPAANLSKPPPSLDDYVKSFQEYRRGGLRPRTTLATSSAPPALVEDPITHPASPSELPPSLDDHERINKNAEEVDVNSAGTPPAQETPATREGQSAEPSMGSRISVKATGEEKQGTDLAQEATDTTISSATPSPAVDNEISETAEADQEDTENVEEVTGDVAGTSPAILPASPALAADNEISESAEVDLEVATLVPLPQPDNNDESSESVGIDQQDTSETAHETSQDTNSVLENQLSDDVPANSESSKHISSTTPDSPPALLLTVDYLKSHPEDAAAESVESHQHDDRRTPHENSQETEPVLEEQSLPVNPESSQHASDTNSGSPPGLLLTVDYLKAHPEDTTVENVESHQQDDPKTSHENLQHTEPVPEKQSNDDVSQERSQSISSTSSAASPPALLLTIDYLKAHPEEAANKSEEACEDDPKETPGSLQDELPALVTQPLSDQTADADSIQDGPVALQETEEAADQSVEACQDNTKGSLESPPEEVPALGTQPSSDLSTNAVVDPVASHEALAPPSVVNNEAHTENSKDSTDNDNNEKVASSSSVEPTLLPAAEIHSQDEIGGELEHKNQYESSEISLNALLPAFANASFPSSEITRDIGNVKDSVKSSPHPSLAELLARDYHSDKPSETLESNQDSPKESSDYSSIPLQPLNTQAPEKLSEEEEEDIQDDFRTSSTSSATSQAQDMLSSDENPRVEEDTHDNTNVSPKTSLAPLPVLDIPAPDDIFHDENDHERSNSSATVSPGPPRALVDDVPSDGQDIEESSDSDPRTWPSPLPFLSSMVPDLIAEYQSATDLEAELQEAELQQSQSQSQNQKLDNQESEDQETATALPTSPPNTTSPTNNEESPNTPPHNNNTYELFHHHRRLPNTTPRQRQGSIFTMDPIGVHDLGPRPLALDYLTSRSIATRQHAFEEEESGDGKVDWDMMTPGSVD